MAFLLCVVALNNPIITAPSGHKALPIGNIFAVYSFLFRKLNFLVGVHAMLWLVTA